MSLLFRRLAAAIATLLATSILVFFTTEILPGDVAEAMLGQSATEEQVAAIREKLELDRPAAERYLSWLSGVVRGEFGDSLTSSTPVRELIVPRAVNTVVLALYAALVAVPLALGLGLLSAAYPFRFPDRAISGITVFFVSIPEFVLGVLLVAALAVQFRIFPAIIYNPDFGRLDHALHQLFLPMLTLVLVLLAHTVRMTRAAILDVLSSSFVEMALLKGVRKWRIILRHALPNALGPVLNVIALNLGYLFSGVVVVEIVFSYPGLGRLLVDSIFYRDIPVIQATTGIFCAIYILLNALADLSLVIFSPRLRFAT